MTPPAALHVYGEGLLGSERLSVMMSDGSEGPVALGRFMGAADAVDEALLDGAAGPVLDLGCGPGRHLHALAHRGIFGLGVDLSPVAVALARGKGVRAIVASVFDELPGAGSWRTALLLDGNIGIGGDPVRLLERVRDLLAGDGEVLVELDRPGTADGSVRARLVSPAGHSASFDWARVPPEALSALAAATGFGVDACWSAEGRWFARLTLPAMISA